MSRLKTFIKKIYSQDDSVGWGMQKNSYMKCKAFAILEGNVDLLNPNSNLARGDAWYLVGAHKAIEHGEASGLGA